MEDSKIISLFFERSEQAIEELDRKHGPAVKRTAANILQDVGRRSLHGRPVFAVQLFNGLL